MGKFEGHEIHPNQWGKFNASKAGYLLHPLPINDIKAERALKKPARMQ